MGRQFNKHREKANVDLSVKCCRPASVTCLYCVLRSLGLCSQAIRSAPQIINDRCLEFATHGVLQFNYCCIELLSYKSLAKDVMYHAIFQPTQPHKAMQ